MSNCRREISLIMLLAFALTTLFLPSGCKRTSDTEKGTSAPTGGKSEATTSALFDALVNEGHACMARWDYPGAITAFRKALEIDPNSVTVRLNLGISHLLNQRAEEAVETLAPLAKSSQPNPQLDYVYGVALSKSSRAVEAVPVLRRAADQAPTDASVRFQLGVALQDSGDEAGATAAYEKVLALDRFHITAAFRLARLARMANRTEEADRWMLRSEQNRAILGADAAEREARGINRFTKPVDPPSDWQPGERKHEARFSLIDVLKTPSTTEATDESKIDSFAMLDVDRDTVPELLVRYGTTWALARFVDDGFNQKQLDALAGIVAPAGRAIVADVDNDGRDDALWIGANGSLLLRQANVGQFENRTLAAGLDAAGGSTAVWIDEDHDGDVDLLVSTDDHSLMLMRNRGDGTFFDDSALLALPDLKAIGHIKEMAIGDLNDDDATDLALAGDAGCAILFNSGASQFNSAFNPPLFFPGGALSEDVNDINNDGKLEAAFAINGTGGSASILFSDPTIPAINFDANAASTIQLGDFDGDGFLDCLSVNVKGIRIDRNEGRRGWSLLFQTIESAGGNSADWSARGRAAVSDWDGDGDIDVIASLGPEHRLTMLRNDAPAPQNALRVTLEGTKANRSGLGTRLDIRSGKSRLFRSVTQWPIAIPTGGHKALDLVKVLWTNGATDAFTNVAADKPLAVVETTITLGSCPYLYVWDGKGFRFVTDILGNAPLGLSYAHKKYVPADTNEIVYLGNESDVGIMTAADGSKRIVVEITDELREILYLDTVRLLVVDREAEMETHTPDKLCFPPFPPSELWSVRNLRSARRVVDDRGLNVTEKLATIDGIRVGPQVLRGSHIRGQAGSHTIALDFEVIDVTAPNLLVLTGWLQYGDASVNIATSQHVDLSNPFPRLEARTSNGEWRALDVAVGAPAGKTKSIIVDLAGKLPPDTTTLRLTAALEIFWDRIVLGERGDSPRLMELSAVSAALRRRGVSLLHRDRLDEPRTPRYESILDSPPWRRIPEGWYTRHGDVLPLLEETDDRYVILSCGDAARIEFEVNALLTLHDGKVREYFLYTDGWDKDMDHNVLTGATVHPLPVHGQDNQTYGTEDYALNSEDWLWEYNSRWVPAEWPE